MKLECRAGRRPTDWAECRLLLRVKLRLDAVIHRLVGVYDATTYNK